MLKVLNLVLPKTKLDVKPAYSEDDNDTLDNFRCQRAIETVIKEQFPEVKAFAILTISKHNEMSSAYCNISPLDRLWVHICGFLQELFDFKVESGGKKKGK